jgi:NADH-ubiquinone oxidoreductase chain 4L
MLLSYILIIISMIGFLCNRRSTIIQFLTIEMMLLGITLNILLYSSYYDDSLGLLWTVVLLIIAGAESTIGLTILVCYYRLIGNIQLPN